MVLDLMLSECLDKRCLPSNLDHRSIKGEVFWGTVIMYKVPEGLPNMVAICLRKWIYNFKSALM